MIQGISVAMKERIIGAAISAGFSDAGIAGVPDIQTSEEQYAGERFTDWIDAGRAAEMDFLKRTDAAGRLLRSSLSVAIPWARSVIVCVLNYGHNAPLSIESAPDGSGWIARYAWSGDLDTNGIMQPTDYHEVMLKKLRIVESALKAELPDGAIESRCYVDTGPILEKEYAQRAGVGWIGKNTCLINESRGSWLLIGVIVTALPLEANAVRLAPDRCGSCTRCIDACPTEALVSERHMDAGLCIAYLTIEKKGTIPEELRGDVGRQIFGCDICQDVCPWNRKAAIGADAALRLRPELVNPDLDWLGSLSQAEFRRVFKGSPLERTGLKRLSRNIAIAMGNSGLEKFRARLTQWSQSDDAVLSDAANWALRHLDTPTGAEKRDC